MVEFFKEEKLQKGRSRIDQIILGSVLSGGIIVLLGIFLYATNLEQIGGALTILGLIISFLPYGIISFLKNRAIRELENQFPNFLKDLAESKRGGMTILQAFESSSETDYGRLNSEIDKIHKELTWGIPFPEVMERFSMRMKDSSVIQESISILLQSFKSGGNITKTIESIAEDSAQLKEVIQQKNAKIKQQILIMYVIYFLFIGITIGIYFMLSELLGLGSPGEGALQNTQFLGGSGGTPNYCDGSVPVANPLCNIAKIFGFVPSEVNSFSSEMAKNFKYGAMAYYKSLLFVMLMVQGMCTGAVAGQIAEGSPSAGVKHALVMIPIAFVVFMYMVGLTGV